MRLLTLLRHARSSHDEPGEVDFNRPLNPRGRRAAERMGRFLAEAGLAFDRVQASPALRVVQTIAGVEAGLGRPLRALFDRRLYLAPADLLFELVRETPDRVGHLLIVGHNPGLEELVQEASIGHPGLLRDEAALKYPTAALATLALPDGTPWSGAGPGTADLVRFIRPRDLDPELGPDR
jgi:phosphohistidine phosphatase